MGKKGRVKKKKYIYSKKEKREGLLVTKVGAS
jgi:hypothetical protein